MSNNVIAVWGFTGSIVAIDTESRFRPYSFGTMSKPPSPRTGRIDVSTTRIAQRLKAAGRRISIYGLIGDDTIGNNITKQLAKNTIQTKNLHTIKKSLSEQLTVTTDSDGYAFAYRFNPFTPQVLGSTLFQIDTLDAGTAAGVITSFNSDVMLHAFKLLGEKNIPIIWNAYMCYNNVSSAQLLENLRHTQVVILSEHEASYFKQSLGFTSVDQIVSEGPSDVLILRYTSDGRIAIDHYDNDRHTVNYNTGKGGLPPSILIDAVDEFSIGMAERVFNDMSFSETVNLCIERINAFPKSTT